MNIDDIENEIGTADAAAIRSMGMEFAGKPLEPFSFIRQSAADAMGCKVVSPAFAQLVERLQDEGSYPGFMADAVAIVWLCSQPIRVAHRAIRKPAEAIEAAHRWAEAQGVSVGKESHAELVECFSEIIEGIFASQAEIDPSGAPGQGGGDSLGESSAAASNTPPSSPAYSLR